MIWESKYWKSDLLRNSEYLRRKLSQKRWPESSMANFEKAIMISFYIIRKLTEANKLSGNIISHKFPAITYKCKDKNVNILNWHKVIDLYNLDQGTDELLDLRYVSNKIIHSFVFIGVFGENNKIEAVMFNSDQSKKDRLHSLNLVDIIDLFKKAGNDYPRHIEYKFNPKSNEYDVLI
jgi:hypothetical protein